MPAPISFDLPHSLGAEEAKRRIAGGVGDLRNYIPGGAADVHAHWTGDSMALRVAAMGQEVNARIDVAERVVHLEVVLQPALSFFGRAIEAALRRGGAELLEDKSKGRG